MSDKEDTEMKVVFAPGCFDSFEGSQEELDEMMAEIMAMVADGSIHDKATPVDFDDLDDDDVEAITEMLARNTPTGERKVH